jgi:tryptophan halogenase
MDIPYEVYYPGSVHPYTTATALSAGRAWDIPLRSKRALGYAYSDAFVDTDRAISELREFEGPHAAELDTRVGSIEVGRREQIWSRNCIAIGSAGHCIEPMSPTSLYLDVIAAVLLAEHFPRDAQTFTML